MLRELVNLSADEAFNWCQARRVEAIAAAMAGSISEAVCDSILEWANDAYLDYLMAASQGLIPPQQVAGEKGGSNE